MIMRKQFNNVEKIFGLLMLVGAILFNLWIYRSEPTARIDPNDNAFQFALVDRANQIWDFANKNCTGFIFSRITCRISFLTDHWVPNWAEGYNLPYYYSHIPQIVIVGSYRFFSWFSNNLTTQQFTNVSLFAYYHWVIYLLLSFFPLSVFLALRVIGMSSVAAGIGAIGAAGLSTDGLYGLDPSSFLWRGYGLSSQLFAMIWLPLALAYAYRLFRVTTQSNAKGATKFSQDVSELRIQKNFRRDRSLAWAVLFLAATTAGHLGIGIIAFLSTGILWISSFIPLTRGQLKNVTIEQCKKLLLLFGGVLFILGYWILPAYAGSDYRNFSVWDPIWKFNSYGAPEVLKNFFNGNLFDFGRFPILTILVFLGFFAALTRSSKKKNPGEAGDYPYLPFALLLVFWLVMYFGRTTWGGLIDLIPTMKEFHLSRFIVGVQIAGLFLIPLGIDWIIKKVSPRIGLFVYLFIGLLVVFLFPQTVRYASVNDTLIRRANANYQKIEPDTRELLSTINALLLARPGRVFAGRPGSWGRDLRIAETPYYLLLSTYGIPTVLWLPETWSPNSDTEQYFSENKLADYQLYNIRYVLSPPDRTPEPFWKLVKETNSWKLYEVASSSPFGYIAAGIRPAVVSSKKEDFTNVVRFWIQSDYPKQGLYPELTFAKDYPRQAGLPNFRMLDEVTYKTPA